MRLVGFFLLLAGWGIVLAAVVVLGSGVPQNSVVFAGFGVEILGLALLIRSFPVPHGARE